jgi:hypothetical protein
MLHWVRQGSPFICMAILNQDVAFSNTQLHLQITAVPMHMHMHFGQHPLQ